MPRVYKPEPGGKRYTRYDQNSIEQAVQEYLRGDDSIKNVAEKYNIHKSVLYRHSKRVMKPQGGQMALPLETEKYIIQYLNVCADWGYPLDSLDLRYIIKIYLDKLGISHKRFKNNLPGPDYIKSFLNRHKDMICQRICQNIKRSRAAVSEIILTKYFDELKISLTDVPPENIVNYDETNLSDDPGRRKIITKRGTKYPERVMNHSKASVSIMMAGSAVGQLLPPYVVYKAQHLYNTWISNGPQGARYNRSASGWFDASIFEDWVQTIAIPYFAGKPGRKLLIGDNLSSHLSVEMIKLCKTQNIDFVFLPTNSTHITQPLDVAFFRPMKITWRQILHTWKKTDGCKETCVPKGCFPRLLKKLIEVIEENAAINLKAGFRKCGIYPFDPEQVLSRIPTQLSETNRYREAVDESVLHVLNDMRYGTMGVKEPRKKRKLDVVAGKSVDEFNARNEGEDSEVTAGPSTLKRQKTNNKQRQRSVNKENDLANNTVHIEKNIKGKGIGKKTKRKESVSMNQSKDKNMEIGLCMNENQYINYPVVAYNCKGKTAENEFKITEATTGQNISMRHLIEQDMTTEIVEGQSKGKPTEISLLNYNEDLSCNIFDMPIYFQDDLECVEEITVENSQLNDSLLGTAIPENSNKKKSFFDQTVDPVGETSNPSYNKEEKSVAESRNIQCITKKEKIITIIENKNFLESNKKICDITKFKKLSPVLPLKISKSIQKRNQYYKNDDAILKDLLDENI